MEIVKGGTLCFWGDWFGRPYDNYHIVVSAEWNTGESILTLLFRNGEKCTVYNPQKIVNEEKQFYISDAKKIEWEWYPYGQECVPQNLCKRTYTYEDSENILLEYSGTMGNGSKTFNPQGKYALEIV